MKYKCIFVFFFFGGLVSAQSPVARHIQFLHKDVEKIGIAGAPGPICVSGDNAFAVIAAGAENEQVAVVAAAEWFSGRIIAFGHGGYLSSGTLEQEDTLPFFNNCIRWICREKSKPVIGVYKNKKLTNYLNKNGQTVQDTDLSNLQSLDLLVIDAHQIPAAKISSIQKFIKSGRGLISAGLGWGWKQLNPGKDLAKDLPGNRLLAPAGLVWSDGMAKKTCPQGYLVGPIEWENLNASIVLEKVLKNRDNPKHFENQSRQMSTMLTMALRSLPPGGNTLLSTVSRLEKELSVKDYPAPPNPFPQETFSVGF